MTEIIHNRVLPSLLEELVPELELIEFLSEDAPTCPQVDIKTLELSTKEKQSELIDEQYECLKRATRHIGLKRFFTSFLSYRANLIETKDSSLDVYDVRALDVNKNGAIDDTDIQLLSAKFGQASPTPSVTATDVASFLKEKAPDLYYVAFPPKQ